jgi:hypothetical protein
MTAVAAWLMIAKTIRVAKTFHTYTLKTLRAAKSLRDQGHARYPADLVNADTGDMRGGSS